MNENNKSGAVSSGIGFTGLLTIAFIVLKLTGTISWSWIWVLSPIWISLALALIVFAAVVIGTILGKRRTLRKTRWK